MSALTKTLLSSAEAKLTAFFSTTDAETITRQLKIGSLVLVDVQAGKNTFRSSISAKGYQTDLGKIRAQGFPNLPE